MMLHTQKSGASFARQAARVALQPVNNNAQNTQPSAPQKISSSVPTKSATAAEIDKIVVSVEDATRRLSQVSTNTNSSKRKSKNHVGPWRLGRTLGRGSTGRVRLAKHSETGKLAAVKIVPKSKFHKDGKEDGNDSSPYGIEREIIIMKLISHQNIMGLYDVWENKGELYLVLEYVEGGELFDYLIKKGKLPEKEALHYFSQIISGVSYCHQFNICHRDLKPENLLLDKNMNIKIADFGMAALEVNHKLLETSCGSPHYASPEIVTGKTYHGSPSDVWSCGIILFALLTGHLPFDDENIRKLLMKVQSGRFIMPNYLSPDAKDLIWKMLNVNPDQRIKINDILRHPLMKKYETSATSGFNKSDREKLDDYYSEVDQLQLKKEDIDRDIIKSLSILFHGATEPTLMPKLLSSRSNPEKMFYFLLFKYKKQHQMNEKQESLHKNKNKHSNGDGMLKKSKSMVKTTITNEDGTTIVKTEPIAMPPLPTTPKKKVVKSSAGQIQISASSSYRRGVSFNNRVINNDNLSRSSSRKSISSGTQGAILSKRRQSLLPPLPDLEIDWLNIGPDSGPSADLQSLYNEIFNLKSPLKTPRASPKKESRSTKPVNRIPLPVAEIDTPQESYMMTSSPIPPPRPSVQSVPSSVPAINHNTTKTLPRQLGNFEVSRRGASQPLPHSRNQTLDPSYKVRSVSDDSAQVLQRFGVSLRRDQKTSSKIYYSKSSTSINLAAILKNDTKSELRIASNVPPLPEHRITSSKYGSFEAGDDGNQDFSSFNTGHNSHDSSFDFELPTTTEVATVVPIANGSNVTVHKSSKVREDSMFVDANLTHQDFLRSSHSSQSVIKNHRKASSNLTQIMTPTLDIRGSLFNNPSDLRDDIPVPMSSFPRPRFSHLDEHNDTKSTIMDNSMFADNTDEEIEYGGAKRVTMIFDDYQEWDPTTASILEPVEPSVEIPVEPAVEPSVEPAVETHKPIKLSPLKQIQDNDFKSTPLMKNSDLQPQRVAPSAPSRDVSDSSTVPAKKTNWFTKFFSSLMSTPVDSGVSLEREKKKKSLSVKVFQCHIPLPALRKATKVALELKHKEGTLVMISETANSIRATVPPTFTLGSPLKFQIDFDVDNRKITLLKLKGSKKLFRNLTNALEFVIDTETQRFNEAVLI